VDFGPNAEAAQTGGGSRLKTLRGFDPPTGISVFAFLMIVAAVATATWFDFTNLPSGRIALTVQRPSGPRSFPA
jgi:hypothetical protein